MAPYFFIRVNRQNIKVTLDSIHYIQADGNYVQIVTAKSSHLTLLTIRQLVKFLPSDSFCQVNRGCIVSIEQIASFDKDSITLVNKIKFPFAEKCRHEFERRQIILTNDYALRKGSFQINEILN